MEAKVVAHMFALCLSFPTGLLFVISVGELKIHWLIVQAILFGLSALQLWILVLVVKKKKA